MNIKLQWHEADGLAARLAARLQEPLAEAALEAGAARLAGAVAAAGVTPQVESRAGARRVGSSDAAAVERELGSLHHPARPWLAPAVAALRGGGR